jgi:hypothetical protein
MKQGGLTDLGPGQVGAVVTYLEMNERPLPKPLPPSPFRLERWREVDPAKYRLLFERVGGRWLWYSRLAMSDAVLRSNVGEVHAVVDRAGIEVGMIELDFSRCLRSDGGRTSCGFASIRARSTTRPHCPPI